MPLVSKPGITKQSKTRLPLSQKPKANIIVADQFICWKRREEKVFMGIDRMMIYDTISTLTDRLSIEGYEKKTNFKMHVFECLQCQIKFQTLTLGIGKVLLLLVFYLPKKQF